MVQLCLFDSPAPVVAPIVSPVAVVSVEVPPSDPGDRLQWEYKRGEFMYWDAGAEARWRSFNSPRPLFPRIPGVSGVRPNSRAPGVWDKPYTWEKMLECGRSYMVGSSVPMGEFIKRHKSSLTDWQKLAYAWAVENPLWRLQVETPGREWEINTEGEYIVFALPHQDAGGERHYITNNGRSKVLVNVD